MTEILFITHFSPNPIGHGGNHRSYQVLTDLQHYFGKSEVQVISVELYAHKVPSAQRRLNYRIINILFRLTKRVMGLFWYILSLGNVYSMLANTQGVEKACFRAKFFPEIKAVRTWAETNPKDKVCIIDHPFLECFIDECRKFQIPVIITSHNLEAFDAYMYQKWSYKTSFYASIQFADEYHCYGRCVKRLMISHLEKDLCDGLGLASSDYPYIPVGEIKASQMAIREARRIQAVEPGLFLIIGSYDHTTAAEGIDWLIGQMISHQQDLPRQLHLIVAGSGSEKISLKHQLPEWINVRGWISQSELDELLKKAAGILIPKRLGFGAVTRASETSCAGVPTIISELPTRAFDLPPGVWVAGDTWSDWLEKINQVLVHPSPVACQLPEYEAWAAKQEAIITEVFEIQLPGMDYD